MNLPKNYLFFRAIFFIIVISFTSCNIVSNGDSLGEAEGILKQARKAIYKGVQSEDIKSILIEKTITGTTTIVTSTTKFSGSDGKEAKIIGDTKINIQFPDKVKKVRRQYMPLPKETESEGDKSNSQLREYNTLLEQEGISSDTYQLKMTLDGEKAGFDFGSVGLFTKPFTIVTGAPFTTEDFYEKDERREDRQLKDSDFIRQDLWVDLFPLLLKMPWDSTVKFKYVGKADANGKRANVLELVSLGNLPEETRTSKAQVKLFFDEKSYLLLLITQKSFSGSGTLETKYHFYNYEVIDGLKVAKKISIESNLPTKNGNEKISTETIIKELQINPTFSPKDFALD